MRCDLRPFAWITNLTLWNVMFISLAELQHLIVSLSSLNNLMLGDPLWRPGFTGPRNADVDAYNGCNIRLSSLILQGDTNWLCDPWSACFLEWLAQSRIASQLVCFFMLHESGITILHDPMLVAVRCIILVARQTLELLEIGFLACIDFSSGKQHQYNNHSPFIY